MPRNANAISNTKRAWMPASLLAAALLIFAGCDGGGGGSPPSGTPGDPSSGPSAAVSVSGGTPANGGTPAARSTASNGETETPAATASPSATGSTALSIDGDTLAVGAQSEASYALAAEFEIVIALDALAEPAAGYQVALTWDPAVLSFVSVTNVAATEFPACSPTLSDAGSVSIACLRTGEDLAYTGPLARITLRCATAGASTLRFRLPAQGVVGTRIESTPSKNFKHDLRLTEAEIRCG
jgi:hypothetical protein